MKRMLVDQKDITRTRLDDVPQTALEDGQARLRLESFAVTANNVTYAASGFTIGYWAFFPSGIDGQGIVPVWGVAKVVESRDDALAPGARLYGFYPAAEEVIITVKSAGQGTIVDAAPHRAALPALYNLYVPIRSGTPEQDHLRALLQPLLATSYLLFDWLMDNDLFGAEQVIIGSASSKTGLGLSKFLAEPESRKYRIIGLTSERNRSFVEGLDTCDHVLSYDEIDTLPQVPSVYVDMAGNSTVKAALHEHLRDNVKHSAAVGLSHWDKFEAKQVLPGARPQFFFAPAQVAKRREEWGPGVIEEKITQAWKRIAAGASQWVELRYHDGLEELPSVYGAFANGTANPKDGHIIRMQDLS